MTVKKGLVYVSLVSLAVGMVACLLYCYRSIVLYNFSGRNITASIGGFHSVLSSEESEKFIMPMDDIIYIKISHQGLHDWYEYQPLVSEKCPAFICRLAYAEDNRIYYISYLHGGRENVFVPEGQPDGYPLNPR